MRDPLIADETLRSERLRGSCGLAAPKRNPAPNLLGYAARSFLGTRVRCLVLQELEVRSLGGDQSVDHKVDKAAVLNVVLGGCLVNAQDIADGALAVRARSANELGDIRVLELVTEGVDDLLELLTCADLVLEVREVVRVHDSEAGAAAAAVVVNTLRGHLADIRAVIV